MLIKCHPHQTASKAVDVLLDSKWAAGKKDLPDALFTDRESVVEFMHQMLLHKFFHRAAHIIVTRPADGEKKKGKKKKIQEADVAAESSAAEDTKGKEKDEKKGKCGSKNEDSESSDTGSKAKDSKRKIKKLVKLDMHTEQLFVDGKEAYVWIYEPPQLKNWFIGAGLVIGSILLCLFPLWPRIVRTYVYYLSIAAAAFLFFIIGLAVLKFILFVLVWCLTLGRHHFWMLPNLTEDVGFFQSFWPLYSHEYKGPTSEADGSEKKRKKKKSKDETHDNNESSVKKDEGPTPDQNVDSPSQKQDADSQNGENGFEILDSNGLEEET